MFFGGACQFLAGAMEFLTGNTVSIKQSPLAQTVTYSLPGKFGATLFPSYSAFNFSYAMIYLPGTGIMEAYTDPQTGTVEPQFNQALGIYLWAWFILTVLFSIAAMRSSWVLFLDLAVLSLCLMLLACGNMVGDEGLLKAGYSFGLVVAFLSCETTFFLREP